MEKDLDNAMTQKLNPVRHQAVKELDVPKTPVPDAVQVRYRRTTSDYRHSIPPDEAAKVRLVEEQCRSFCLSLFFRRRDAVRSLGITSSIPGEGKSFVAFMMAQVLANDSMRPVVLIELDWENTALVEHFGYPSNRGIAEWLRRDCTAGDIRYQFNDNLTIIPAGNGQPDAVKLLQQIRKRGLRQMFAPNDENLIIDLPAVITNSYGVLAASMVDALALVVRAGATTVDLVADACTILQDLPVQGIILNQAESRPWTHHPARRS